MHGRVRHRQKQVAESLGQRLDATAVWRILVASLVASGIAAAVGPSVAATPDRIPPNIVLVLVDDFATGDLDYLPRLRELTSERGKSFRMIVSSPRCAPSRASILTGQYPHNHGVLGNAPRTGGWKHLKEREDELVPCWLSARAYKTHYSGKYINGYGRPADHVPPCWTDWQALTEPSGDDRFTFAINANGDVEHHTGQYQTDVLAAKTVAFIEQTSEPFFAVLAPFSPHSPWVAAEKYQGSMSDLVIRRSPSFNEADVSDKWNEYPALTPATVELLDERVKLRIEMMRSVEDALDRVLTALESRGFTGRTYVFFTSDNGYLNGEHRIALGKGVPYREATEVPLIVSGPGIPPGSKSRRLVANHDLAPTFGDLAAAPIPSFVDGRSAVPVLTDERHPWRRRVLLEHWSRSKGLLWNGLRSADGVQIKWIGGPWESYDYTTDPNEMTSLDDGEDPILQQLAACSGRECRRLERRRIGSVIAMCRLRPETQLLQVRGDLVCRQAPLLRRSLVRFSTH